MRAGPPSSRLRKKTPATRPRPCVRLAAAQCSVLSGFILSQSLSHEVSLCVLQARGFDGFCRVNLDEVKVRSAE